MTRAVAVAYGPLRDRMNQTERAYANELELLCAAGKILGWEWQGITLKLAHDTRYTPDFNVLLNDRTLRMDEVKGFWRDDALVKIKVAAERYRWFSFQAVQRTGGKRSGWKFTEFKS